MKLSDRKIEFEKIRIMRGEESKIKKIKKSFIEIIQQTEGKIGLDIGCGAGLEANDLSKMGFMVIGLDINKDLLRLARHNVSEVNFILGSAGHLPISSRTIDLVTVFDVLEHVDHPYLMLREIKRVLKRNGHFVLTIPNGWSLGEFIHWFHSLMESEKKGITHMNYFNYFQIRRYTNMLKFHINFFEPQWGFFSPLIVLPMRLILNIALRCFMRDDKKVMQLLSQLRIIPSRLEQFLAGLDNYIKSTKFFILFYGFVFIFTST